MGNVAYNMDCMEAMRSMPDKCFDLAVVDPPYGLDICNMNMGAGTSPRCSKIENRQWHKTDWDKQAPPPEYFTELFRVSVNQVIWGGQLLQPTTDKGLYRMGQRRGAIRA